MADETCKKKGTVKWFNPKKRIGYIKDEDGNDQFVHASGISDGRTYVGLEDGDEVEFEIVQGKNGREKAVNVVLTTKVEDLPKDE